jgi:hypothetical protein
MRAGLPVVQFTRNRFEGDTGLLLPGQVAHFFIPADNRTDTLTITISQVTPAGPQNALFGDALFVMAVDAPTSIAVHRIVTAPSGMPGVFVNGDATFVLDHPQTGLVRLGIQGRWTNAGATSAHVTITRERHPLNPPTATGRVMQDDFIPLLVDVPADASEALFELFWQQNWARYPTNDLDMYIFRPDGIQVVADDHRPPGATLASPERVVVPDPMSGTWTVFVHGFAVQDDGTRRRMARDRFSLRVSADGVPLGLAPSDGGEMTGLAPATPIATTADQP